MNKLDKFFKQTFRRMTWLFYRKERLFRNTIKELVTDNCKLHIGCGLKKLQGYINIDIVPLEGCDVVMDATNEMPAIPSNVAVEIRMENVFEHFYRHQQDKALKEYYRILKTGGKLVIKGLPNLDAIIQAYLNKEKGLVGPEFDLFNVYRFTHGEPEQGNNPVHQLHKDIFTKTSVQELLKNTGFRIESIENEQYSHEENPLCLTVIAVK
ncbi:MAG: methyltransferase domain-containing protein [Candidatus Omnitrophica bacterium]|nr:methyltransferase domain-containing protein [Candidatus Omnitrophota bacterium]